MRGSGMQAEYTQEFLEKVRMYFFNKEGYMASDRICINYWYEHGESDDSRSTANSNNTNR